MKTETNVLIAGVGGQGAVLMSDILGNAAVIDGLPIKGTEVIGGSQRGGCVNSMLRMGGDVQSPAVPEGRGDLMIGLEPAESLRNLIYMAKTGVIVLNARIIMPQYAVLGLGKYPELDDIIGKLKENSANLVVLNAAKLAEEAGSGRAANIVMLGAAFGTGLLPIRQETVKSVIDRSFGKKAGAINIRAFDLGYQACKAQLAV
jgi:indolepyruvate ferredoxin oxidoreductase beta subunit